MAPDATLMTENKTFSASSSGAESDDAILDSPVYTLISVPALLVAATVTGATFFGILMVILASSGFLGTGYEFSLGG